MDCNNNDNSKFARIALNQQTIPLFVKLYQDHCNNTNCNKFVNNSNIYSNFYNEEPDVDAFLNENMHLVWYGHFYKLFPNYWSLIPQVAPAYEVTMDWKEKAKVRCICQICSHTWTSRNSYVQFWIASPYRVYFDLPGANCSQCLAKNQPVIWYPDEAVRVLDNLYGYLTGGRIGRDFMEKQVLFRRGYGMKKNKRNRIQSNATSSYQSLLNEENINSHLKSGNKFNEYNKNANCKDLRSRLSLSIGSNDSGVDEQVEFLDDF